MERASRRETTSPAWDRTLRFADRVLGEAQAPGDLAGRHASRPFRDEKAKDGEPTFMGQGGQDGYGGSHARISTTIDI